MIGSSLCDSGHAVCGTGHVVGAASTARPWQEGCLLHTDDPIIALSAPRWRDIISISPRPLMGSIRRHVDADS